MLVGMESVAVRAEYEIVNCGVQPLFVGQLMLGISSV